MTLLSCAQRLIQFPSLTPDEAGSLAYLDDLLKSMGLRTTFFNFGQVHNLYARWGTQAPHLCFAGHVDVVPPGLLDQWSVPPFEGVVKDGKLWGRGSADMKGAIAAFIYAVQDFLMTPPPKGSISLLLTSDEEGDGIDGIQRVIPYLKEQKENIDFCLIGEPSGFEKELRIGRRGSFHGHITYYGKQGHIARPDDADNPIPKLISFLKELSETTLDNGTENFGPSHLAITELNVLNPVKNLIPAQGSARFGIRFNPLHTEASLTDWIHTLCQKHMNQNYQLTTRITAKPFLTKDQYAIEKVVKAIQKVTGKIPSCNTGGGTDDGRFLINLAPVVTCGLSPETIHKTDEHVSIQELETLQKVYYQILKDFLG